MLIAASAFLLSSNGGDIVPSSAVMAESPYQVNLHFFYSDTCSHCSDEKVFLEELQSDYDNLVIKRYWMDSMNNPNIAYNNQLLDDVSSTFEQEPVVPFTVLGGKAFAGFNETTEYLIRKYVIKYTNEVHADVVQKIIDGEEIVAGDIDTTEDNVVILPILGIVDLRTVSLGAAAVALGFVDGFNPCAMWVLLFLITLLLPTKDRKRIFLLGGLFLLSSAVFYFALMMAWINTAGLLAASQWFQIAIGVFAVLAGGFNLYQFIKNIRQKDVGCEVTDETQRVKLMDRVKRIVNQNSLILAIIGVIALAIIVNFIELACSAGLPLLFAQILAFNGLSGWSSVGYVLLYIFFFILDDLVVFTIVMLTLKIKVVSNKIARYNHLIGGLIMIAIGILMVFFPNILLLNF
jgi:thiol-disulfide isomerase/thioredoxin